MRRPWPILTAAIAAVLLISAVAVVSLLGSPDATSGPSATGATGRTTPAAALETSSTAASATSAPGAGASATPVPPTPVAISAGSAVGSGDTGPFTASTKIPGLGEAVTWRFSGGPALAGAALDIQATDRAFPVAFSTVGTATADADGTAYWTTSYDHPAYLSVRAVAAASPTATGATSPARIASWRGHGACPVQVTAPPDDLPAPTAAAGAGGTSYALRSGWTATGDEQTVLVATGPAGAWSYTFPPCARPDPPVVGGDGTVYAQTSTRQAFTGGRLFVFGSSGLRATRSLSGLLGGLVRSPDGTVYLAAQRETARPGSSWAGIWHASYLAALDGSGRPCAGWPYVSAVPLSAPSFGPAGTVYLAAGFQLSWPDIPASATRRSRVVALRPNGSPLPGWPFTLPAGTAATITSIAEGNDQLYPQPPVVSADGTVFVIATSGDWPNERDLVYAIGADGRARAGWPYATRVSRSGFTMATGGAPGAIPPAAGPDGTVYLIHTVGTPAAWHEEFVALSANGRVRTGWPVALPAERTPVLEACPVAAGYVGGCWLRRGSGGELVLSLGPSPGSPNTVVPYCLTRDAKNVACPLGSGELLP